MTLALFAPIPAPGDHIVLPDGSTVPAAEVSAVPSAGESIVTLGIEWDEGTPRGSVHGVISVDALGTVTGTLDGLRPCPYTVGDQL